MTDTKTHVIGLGAQKAGTTWLHHYLRSDPRVAPLNHKEHHVWDALYAAAQKQALVSPADLLTSEDERKAIAQACDTSPLGLRRGMQADPERYFDYFAGFLNNESIQVTCDITPSYALLPVEAYLRLQRGFAERGIRCLFVFYMRDPVERCLSAARMRYAKMKREDPDGWPPDYNTLVRRFAGRFDYQLRTRYDLTIGALSLAVPEDQIFIGLYETMFEPRSVEALSEFVGIEARPKLGQRRVFETSKNLIAEDSVKASIAATYEEVYQYCAERFPETRDLWVGWRYL